MAKLRFLPLIFSLLLLSACNDAPAPPASPTSTSGSATPTTKITTPERSTPTSDAAGPAATEEVSGSIIYLDTDGVTVRKMRPDGSDGESLTVVEKDDDEYVSSLTADPTGQYLVYGLSTERYSFISRYFIYNEGETKPLPGIDLAERPVWSPDGKRIAGQTYRNAIEPGGVYVYDLGAATA